MGSESAEKWMREDYERNKKAEKPKEWDKPLVMEKCNRDIGRKQEEYDGCNYTCYGKSD